MQLVRNTLQCPHCDSECQLHERPAEGKRNVTFRFKCSSNVYTECRSLSKALMDESWFSKTDDGLRIMDFIYFQSQEVPPRKIREMLCIAKCYASANRRRLSGKNSTSMPATKKWLQSMKKLAAQRTLSRQMLPTCARNENAWEEFLEGVKRVKKCLYVAVERKSRRIAVELAGRPDENQETAEAFAVAHIAENSHIESDAGAAFANLGHLLNSTHATVPHCRAFATSEGVHSNTVEGRNMLIKRWLKWRCGTS